MARETEPQFSKMAEGVADLSVDKIKAPTISEHDRLRASRVVALSVPVSEVSDMLAMLGLKEEK